MLGGNIKNFNYNTYAVVMVFMFGTADQVDGRQLNLLTICGKQVTVCELKELRNLYNL